MNPLKKKIAAGGLLTASMITGGAIGAAVLGGTANAQTTSDSSTSSTAPSTDSSTAPGRPAHDPTKGGHVGANGVTEELLTGDTAASVTAAAQAAVPDGTIDRVENDAEGATYEAHMTKADGSHVTVKLDASFNVTGIEDGPGR
jgi:hypothetical protein